MFRVRRIAENLFEEEPLGHFRFVPFVEGLNE
jgi:hypothetical protein